MDHLIGFRLRRDIYSENGVVLLYSHTLLRKEHIEKLKDHKIYISDYDVISELEEAVEEKVEENTIGSIIENTTSQMTEIFHSIAESNKIPINDVKEIVPNIREMSHNKGLFNLFNELQSKDDYTYRHNVAVGALSGLIGKWMKLKEKDIATLTLSGLLHDIGKTKIPNEILNKPGKLTPEEFEIIKKHPVYGYDLIKNTDGLSEDIALVALQHHEREQGEGYPQGLKSDQITFYSKIVAVADVFHAMTSKRVYHEAKPFYQVFKEMNQDLFGSLNPKVISVFSKKMLDSLVGNNVILSNEKVAQIIMINPFDPSSPIVKINDEIVDLSQYKSLKIEKVLPA